MAILVEVFVHRASRDDAHRFDACIEAALMERGGPPEGLMVHVGRPEGEGFLMLDVWRSEREWRPFFDEVIKPSLAAVRLPAEEPRVSPVWSFAKP